MHGCKIVSSSDKYWIIMEKYLKHHAGFVIIGEGEIKY